MSRTASAVLSAAFVLLASALCRPARAATLADVDALLQKANAGLKQESKDRAAKFQAAIESAREALELLEKVQGLSDEARDRKAADIMSVIYWCRKMMPLDLSGRQLASKSTRTEKPTRPGAPPEGTKKKDAPPPEKETEFDRLAFERAQKYATRHSDDLEGILLRYEGVAASYPKTKWGKKAAGQAESTREKLEAARKAVLAARQEQIRRLELAEAVAALDSDIRKERNPSRKAQLRQLKRDIGALDELWQRVIKGLECVLLTMHHPLGELGIDQKGWVLRGGRDGLEVAMRSRNAPPRSMPWQDLGAAPMVRLGQKLLNVRDADDIESLAVGATVAGDFMLAHSMFERLLPLAPERVVKVAGYFERAQTGYRSSAEGSAKIRFQEARKLVRQTKYAEAMAIVNGLRKELAKNSSLQEYLREVNDFRRKTMRKYQIDDAGQPINAFQKKVRKLFGGDVKLDEDTGAIEVVYDFEDKGQLRDWIVARQFGQPTVKGGWTVMKGKAHCTGRGTYLMWKFPVSDWDFQADITYADRGKGVVVCGGMNQQAPLGAAAYIKGGRATSYYWRSYYYYFSSGTSRRKRIIWRPGEVASVRMRPWPGYVGDYLVEINGEFAGYTYDSYGADPQAGPMAFGFDGGRGTVDNVTIEGTLDLRWFMQHATRSR